ncbi:MAG: ABC transporter permease [Bacteroidales bacterium]|nr:ABC transporter permease [Bacteroidales bacterium]
MKGFWIWAGALARSVGESFALALSQFRSDRFRTGLSLSGIAIGIFSTVAALTLVDSVHQTMNDGFADFGGDLVLVEQIPLEPDFDEEGGLRWWDYLGRPPVTREEYRFLAENGTHIDLIGYTQCSNRDLILGVWGNWQLAVHNPIAQGRTFSAAELSSGRAVALVGAGYADTHPGEKSVSIDGRRFDIIGTFARSGINAVSLADIDESVVIPGEAARTLFGASEGRSTITIQPKPGVSEEALDAEIRTLLREYRHLDPTAPDNFALNRFSFIIREMGDLFSLIDTIGWIIGLFSLLIGGFGIANILFVAVKERTREIGIQKALGATQGTISLQFLTEAATLSLAGGGAGLAAVWLLTLPLRRSLVPLTLSAGHLCTGILTALIIGIAAGMAPAISAAKMHPARAVASPEGVS